MRITTDIKYYLFRSTIFFAYFFLLTAFAIKSEGNKFPKANTLVNIVQENNDLTVSVKTSTNTNIKFYMFSVEGRLIKQLNIYGSNRISITQLEKGIYIYDFFSNDKRLKNGKIELR